MKISDKWRQRWRVWGRRVLYVAAIVYLLALYAAVDSIQSDVSSIQSDISSIATGTCTNDHLCP
jgi:hypothetical protein